MWANIGPTFFFKESDVVDSFHLAKLHVYCINIYYTNIYMYKCNYWVELKVWSVEIFRKKTSNMNILWFHYKYLWTLIFMDLVHHSFKDTWICNQWCHQFNMWLFTFIYCTSMNIKFHRSAWKSWYITNIDESQYLIEVRAVQK